MVVLFIKLHVGVFHFFGGYWIVNHLEISFSGRFYTTVLGRKRLTG